MVLIREKGIWRAIARWKGKLIVGTFTYLDMAIEWAYATEKNTSNI